jgi:hypothetical protein
VKGKVEREEATKEKERENEREEVKNIIQVLEQTKIKKK